MTRVGAPECLPKGFNPNKATIAALARLFSGVSNLPTVLIESDQREGRGGYGKTRMFDFDELKDLYNQNGTLRARGIKNLGNQVYSPPFRSSLCIAQNSPIEASEAIYQRIIQLSFRQIECTRESEQAVNRLSKIETDDLSGFAFHILKRGNDFLKQIGAQFERSQARFQLPQYAYF